MKKERKNHKIKTYIIIKYSSLFQNNEKIIEIITLICYTFFMYVKKQ